jgi:hypothetical protein
MSPINYVRPFQEDGGWHALKSLPRKTEKLTGRSFAGLPWASPIKAGYSNRLPVALAHRQSIREKYHKENLYSLSAMSECHTVPCLEPGIQTQMIQIHRASGGSAGQDER